jgi:CDP-glucose 4,6-dehydratase
MVNPLSIYAGKRVLVTGHTGFKGPWLCQMLQELGADVAGFALPPEEGSHFQALGLARRMRHVEGDVRDFAALTSLMDDYAPEFVFHLAAQSLVRQSYDEPRETFETNVTGSVNVLEAVRRCGAVRSLVYVTSDKCYQNREWEWGYRENDRLGGHDPYSASKAAAELVFAGYQASFFEAREGFGAASTRAGNVIGGGDWSKDRIVPDCIRALQADTPIRVRNRASTRPWQHVLESLYGYLVIGGRLHAEPKRYAGAWNFGPDDPDTRTVEELAETVVRLWGKGSVVFDAPDPSRHETRTLQLNCEKAHRVLGWHPCWNFDRAVRETVTWYRAVGSGTPATDVTRAQVQQYLREAVGAAAVA